MYSEKLSFVSCGAMSQDPGSYIRIHERMLALLCFPSKEIHCNVQCSLVYFILFSLFPYEITKWISQACRISD